MYLKAAFPAEFKQDILIDSVLLSLHFISSRLRGVAKGAKIAFFDVGGEDDEEAVSPPYPDGKSTYRVIAPPRKIKRLRHKCCGKCC